MREGISRTQCSLSPPAQGSTGSSWIRCPGLGFVGRDLLEATGDDDAPARAVGAVEAVDLEAAVRADPLVELQPWIGAEDDRLAIHAVVHGQDQRSTVGHDGEPPDLVGSQELQAPGPVHHLDAGGHARILRRHGRRSPGPFVPLAPGPTALLLRATLADAAPSRSAGVTQGGKRWGGWYRGAAGDRLSVQLEEWLGDGSTKTVGGLVTRFGPHSFAVVFVLLMALPALPLPTGGVTHVLEVATMLLALELIVGRREVWLPARWQDKELPALASPRFQRALLGRVRWCERWSRPRMAHLLERGLVHRLYGLVILTFALVAFVAPPFSGLDTLPALGAVVLSLGVLLGDVVVAMVGVAIGTAGTVLVIGLARAVTGLLW